MESRTYQVVTFGCKVNTYESQGLREHLESRGFKEGNDPEIVVVNTCAVTAVAEKKCLSRVRSLAKRFPTARLGVVGCSSQLNAQKYREIEGVAAVAGNSGKVSLVDFLVDGSSSADLHRPSIRHEAYEDAIKISSFGHEFRAFVKIQDGCDNFCSYCVIPYVRGNSRSRAKEEIICEVKRLFQSGYHELVLTGIDMGDYHDPNSPDYLLENLIADLIAVTPRSGRLRVSSLEASQVTPGIMELFCTFPRALVSHLHIPLQSGSARILSLMNRRYDLEQFSTLVNTVRTHLSDVGLSTDVIVGFPGEGEKEFAETLSFIKKLDFMRLHIFPYSKRPGTAASSMLLQVSAEIKKSRVHQLINLSDLLHERFRLSQVGKTLTVLFESVAGEEGHRRYRGYSENYLEVEIESADDLLGKFCLVRVTAENYELLRIADDTIRTSANL